MLFNDMAKVLFEKINLDNLTANDNYLIWERTDKFGRAYYGVSHFYTLENDISIDEELSWLEWDGNEVCISFSEFELLESKYREAISILNSWKAQLKKFSDSKFCIILSFDNGYLMDDEDRIFSFMLRFWKERSESELITDINDFNQPIIIEYCN